VFVIATLLRWCLLRLHLGLHVLCTTWTRLSALPWYVAVFESFLLDLLLKDELSRILDCLLTAPGPASFCSLGVDFAVLDFRVAFALVGLLAHLLLYQILHALCSLRFHFVKCFLVTIVGTAEDFVLVGIDRLMILERNFARYMLMTRFR
jgi:hypothetical protein